MTERITVVGAGLVGSLLAIYLARRGYHVDLHERRPDMRKEKISAGRSINLAISTRGINALSRLGIENEILAQAVPMHGRLIHGLSGELSFQPYGKDDSEFINSISRATLNKALMTYAEGTGRVDIHFNSRLVSVNLGAKQALFKNENNSGPETNMSFERIIGTDGSASVIRHALLKQPGYECNESLLNYAYKELLIQPEPSGAFKMEKNALHIWPRGQFMLIALPNFEGSFTCTLFLPYEGEPSFAKLKTSEQVEAFFKTYFPDAVPLLDNLTETFFSNPTGQMITIKSFPWHWKGDVLLMGDAAHAIVPFYGQGMNCGFEDCTIFDQLLEQNTNNGSKVDWSELFLKMSELRKTNADAIADMAVENFIEMRDKVADPDFLMQKAVEKILQKELPGRYVSRYALVTFSNVPYRLALEVGVVSDEILSKLCQGLKRAEDVDLKLAEKLIGEKLSPLLKGYERELAQTKR